MLQASLTIDVQNVPELIAELRREMAAILRAEAQDEPSRYVRERLESIAATFECGQMETGDGG